MHNTQYQEKAPTHLFWQVALIETLEKWEWNGMGPQGAHMVPNSESETSILVI